MSNKKIIFLFGNEKKCEIQSNGKEKMNDIINNRLTSKIDIDLSSSCFLYSSLPLETNLTFDDIANQDDKERKEMNIYIVSSKDDLENKEILVKSKNIICPQCKGLCKINIYDYKIALYECKNNSNHKASNIFFTDFDYTQMVDESKIICFKCQESKRDTYKNQFYLCKICNQNLCPLCKENHRKNHNILSIFLA